MKNDNIQIRKHINVNQYSNFIDWLFGPFVNEMLYCICILGPREAMLFSDSCPLSGSSTRSSSQITQQNYKSQQLVENCKITKDQ